MLGRVQKGLEGRCPWRLEYWIAMIPAQSAEAWTAGRLSLLGDILVALLLDNRLHIEWP